MIWDTIITTGEILKSILFGAGFLLMIMSAALASDPEREKIFLLWALVILLTGIWDRLP